MSYESMANFLVHKIKRVSVSESADPNKWPTNNSWGNTPSGGWPRLDNPYVPKQNNNSSWKASDTGIVTEEEMQKKQATKKYRSIDDPWEES
jgi:hypothetical protein